MGSYKRMFKNTIDNHLATRHVLKTPLKVSWLKITPIQSYERPRIRLELYGFDTCIDPLGVDSLPQSAFSASTFKTGNEPWRAKLGAAIGEHWCPETPNDQYIAIDLGKVFIVTAIGIEGDEVGGNFVHTFHLGYKEQEHEQWVMYSEYSNEDAFAAELLKATNARKPKVLTKLRRKLQARFVKIMPYDKIALPCLRVEFYGCKVCNTDLGIEIYELNDGAFTASGYLNSQTAPFMARLNSARGLGGWCAGRSETRPYLQVDLFWVRQVNKLAIQGLLDNTSWVKTFTVSYREDGKDWQNYVENTAVKIKSN
ncbi:Coagulation factor V [Exaiptasia diaphana]|nr:Coagulation factor V [Exaiptasia diaphana]